MILRCPACEVPLTRQESQQRQCPSCSASLEPLGQQPTEAAKSVSLTTKLRVLNEDGEWLDPDARAAARQPAGATLGSRWKQQCGGLFLGLLSAAGTGYGWYLVLHEGISVRARLLRLFPITFVLGIALILFPTYREERLARGEDISNVSEWRLVTPRWWCVVVIAIAFGGLNYALLSGR